MNIGIIGTGKIAHRMALTCQKLDGFTVTAAAARDFDKTRGFCKEFSIARAYEMYQDLLHDEQVDLVYIGTPHADHYAHARDALLAGKPVLCEKPFTVNARQAEALCLLAEEKKLFITEALWTRYMPWRRYVDDILSAGTIGEVRHITASLGYLTEHLPRLIDPACAGGALLDIGVYVLNFAMMFAGAPVQKVASDALLGGTCVDLTDAVSLRFDNGVTASLSATIRAAGSRRGVISGVKGWIEVDNVIRGGLRPGEGVHVFDASSRQQIAFFDACPEITGFEYQLRACRDALAEGRTQCPEAMHADTVLRMQLMDRLRASWGVRYPFEA